MPRLVYKLPKYSLHKPSGHARVKYNGKTTYLGKYGSPESHELYAQFVAALPKPAETPTFAEPAPGAILLLGEIVLRYFAHAQQYYVRDGEPTGEHVTIRCALAPLTEMFDALPASQFGPKRLKQVREAMIKRKWSRRYINKAVNLIKRCFKWAASEEFVPAETAMGLRTVQGLMEGRTAAREKEPVKPVEDCHVEAVLPHVTELVGDVLRTMRLTGMRPGEVLSMTPAEIDRTDPTLWVYKPGKHKTAHHGLSRTIYLGPKAQAIILPRFVRTGEGGKLFPITRDGLLCSVKRACVDASVPPFSPNQLRHTVGTEVRAQFGLEAAQVILGHSRADVTQTYAERDMSKAQEVARKLG
jgi:integrase